VNNEESWVDERALVWLNKATCVLNFEVVVDLTSVLFTVVGISSLLHHLGELSTLEFALLSSLQAGLEHDTVDDLVDGHVLSHHENGIVQSVLGADVGLAWLR